MLTNSSPHISLFLRALFNFPALSFFPVNFLLLCFIFLPPHTMAAPAPLVNIVVPPNLCPQTADLFGFPAPGTALANPTMKDYINAEILLKHSDSLPAADQAAIKQFCGDVMLAVHPNIQAILAAAVAPLAAQQAAMAAQLAAMAAQQVAMADQLAAMADQLAALAPLAAKIAPMAAMLARQCANDIRRAHAILGINDSLLKLPCEKIHVDLAPNIEPPSRLFG